MQRVSFSHFMLTSATASNIKVNYEAEDENDE